MSSTRNIISPQFESDSKVREVNGNQYGALFSRFSFLQEVKSAGNTRTFLASDHSLGAKAPVLVKIFSADGNDEPGQLLAFLVEGHAAAKLSHPNIAASAKPEQIEGIQFCVSQYQQDGETLDSLLKHQGWFEVPQVIDIACQIAAALQYAHESQVLHLKLQPETISVDREGRVKVTDFGLFNEPARPWAYQKRAQECPLVYRSPEQLINGNPDERTDLYHLGVVLYEVLTDKLPFTATNEKQLRQKIANQRAPAAHLIRPDIPEALSGILARLLADDPAARFQSAAALKSALTNISIRPVPQLITQTGEPATDWDEQMESEPLTIKFDEDEDFLAYEFHNDSLSSPLSFTDSEAPNEQPAEEPQNQPPLYPEWLAAAKPNAPASLPTFSDQQIQVNDRDVPASPPAPFSQREGSFGVPEPANRRQSSPFFLLASAIILITAVSVLAYKGYFKSSFYAVSASNQTGGNRDAMASEITSASASKSQAPGASENRAALPPATGESAASTTPAPEDRTRTANPEPATLPEPIRTRSGAPAPRTTPDTSGLRQQLRQQNRRQAVKARKNKAKVRTVKAKSRKGIFRWRFW